MASLKLLSSFSEAALTEVVYQSWQHGLQSAAYLALRDLRAPLGKIKRHRAVALKSFIIRGR